MICTHARGVVFRRESEERDEYARTHDILYCSVLTGTEELLQWLVPVCEVGQDHEWVRSTVGSDWEGYDG
jgi:hypothetical protein